MARRGEDLAAWFLRRRGGEVLARNVRAGRGEIDLVVRFGDGAAAVEVKTAHDVEPLANFSDRKAAAVRRTARALVPPVHRVDLVTVTLRAEGVAFRWLRDV